MQHAGNPGSMTSRWTFTGAPKDGLDAVKIALTPVVVESPAQNFVYWAFEGSFADRTAWYFGLQPNGEYGKTALFSVFGANAEPASVQCAAGADGGAGTHCHIRYDWTLGSAYQFIVRLVGGDSQHFVWQGVVADLATNRVTEIGQISVAATRGLLEPGGATFSEFFHRTVPCPQQPRSEALWQQAMGYRGNQPFAGAITSVNADSTCNPSFYGDGKTYVYQDNGY